MRRRLARSCSPKARFWLLGRNAAEREKKICVAPNPEQVRQLGDELGRAVFGESKIERVAD